MTTRSLGSLKQVSSTSPSAIVSTSESAASKTPAGELDAHPALPTQDRTGRARDDHGTDQWSSDFDGGLGLLLCLISVDHPGS
jgi:hypothetical protein